MIYCLDKIGEIMLPFDISPLRELRSFAYGVQMDLKAVQNAITMNISNGIIEGYVNKLKAVKR